MPDVVLPETVCAAGVGHRPAPPSRATRGRSTGTRVSYGRSSPPSDTFARFLGPDGAIAGFPTAATKAFTTRHDHDVTADITGQVSIADSSPRNRDRRKYENVKVLSVGQSKTLHETNADTCTQAHFNLKLFERSPRYFRIYGRFLTDVIFSVSRDVHTVFKH